MSTPALSWHRRGCYYFRIKQTNVYFPKGWTLEQCKPHQARILLEYQATGIIPRNTARRLQETGPTVNMLIARYKLHCERHYVNKASVPTSEQNCIRQALRPLTRLYGPTALADFGPVALAAVRDASASGSWMNDAEREFAAKRGQPIGRCRNVTNRDLGRLKRLFRWGVSQQLVTAEKLVALETVDGIPAHRGRARETGDVGPPVPGAVDQVLPLLSRQLAAVATLQRLTGLRPSEALEAKVCDFDRTGELLAEFGLPLPPELAGKVWAFCPERHKNAWRGTKRIVPINEEAQALLRPWLDGRRPGDYLFSPAEARRERNLERRRLRKTRVQPSQRDRRKREPAKTYGAHYVETSYAQQVRKACLKAGVTPWTPHQLRHEAAHRLVRAYGKAIAQFILGHETVAMVDHYARQQVAQDRLIEAFQAVSGRAG